ncbi:MAG TPA: LacI family DNA-binding transcriptional regulator [Patescibacteria group bacterium]|nr:LacI family DNA-binding transcriptional regulator [Patescibacteria group bacterium]
MARTLDDVASLSGVSRATVSRVINGGPVAERTRLHVLAVLEETNFRPNTAARTLASGRSGVVGVVLHIDPHLLFGDRYFSQLLQGISDVLAERETGMMLWLGNRSKEETLDRILAMSLLDGVIVTAHSLQDHLVDGLLASGRPTVLVGHRRADRTASYVDIDNIVAADIVTSHLIASGRRRIGHVTGARGTFAAEDRITGYQHALRRAGLAIDELLADGDYTEAAGAAGSVKLLERGVDAIFCANDVAARGALGVLHERGLRVPEDVALAGFDDLDFAAHLDPPLTTVRQSIRQQGAEAARSLLQLVEDPSGRPRRVILPTELVIRHSTVGGVPRA